MLIIFIYNFKSGYKSYINVILASNVDINDPFFYMSLLNVYYITIFKLQNKYWILNQVEILQACYLGIQMQWVILS
jgi:hypothetical protein